MIPIHPTKNIGLCTCLLLIAAFAISEQTISAQQQEPEWYAKPFFISPYASSPSPTGYSPDQIKTAYNLPSSGGAGYTIAIIDAYDTPNILDYFNTFSSTFNLQDNSTGNFIVHKMPGTTKTDSNWAMETCLDVEWAHAIAPNATILLVEAVSPSSTNLLNAVDYATSQPGVVAVSMSWGGEEFISQTLYDSYFNKQGIVFFASSGDDGTYVNWPAASAYVVSVGGTTLNLRTDGSVISETAWRNSSGGLSNSVARPNFQTNFGLTYATRAVPDVSYNANVTTGVSVYNGEWWKVGGTSAGAPQWAAIQALGLSATNTNMYARAKTTYSFYFRDISSGSNYVDSTATGYDLVTGLGSPLTINFATQVMVSPTSGMPGAIINLTGTAFVGSSVNISYLNPQTATWVSVSNNTSAASGSFSMPVSAPDLMQTNPPGDNPQSFDGIVFCVTDNSNGRSYNASTSYNEYRRGLTQVGNLTAQGLFGNNTNLANSVSIQNGDTLTIAGRWFSPGTATLLWDNTNISTTTIDGAGQFNASIIVPAASVGQHTLAIQDSATSFCVNVSRYPSVATDYTDNWYTADYMVNFVPDYPVNETFYRINGGKVQNVTANGQPLITMEAANNTVEYWSTWSPDGSTLIETPHRIVGGIKLDKTAPLGSIMSNSLTQTADIILYLNANDDTSGVSEMRFSQQNGDWTSWETYTAMKAWTLHGYDGAKTVFVQFRDNAGLMSTYTCVVTLQTQASSTPHVTTAPTPAASPTATPTPTQAAPSPTTSQTPEPSPTPIAEFPVGLALLLVALASLLMALVLKKRK